MDKVKTLIKSSPVVIALIYIIAGFLWIQFSDQWVFSMFDDPESITRIQSLKGWFFVAASGLIIYLLVWQNNKMLGNVIRDLNRTSKKFESTIENAPVGIAHHNADGKWLEVNQALCDLIGYNRQELMKLDFDEFIHPDDFERGRAFDNKLASGEIRHYEIEKRYIRKDGSEFPGLIRKAIVYDNNQSTPYFIAILEDITRQKNHEEQIRKSLREKETLLAEVHHRVKNNLALISAFLNLQEMHIDNRELHSILNKSKMRINCLALIHESFSQNETTVDINFSEFLDELTNYLISSLSSENNNVTVTKKFEPLQLNINIAIPVSLILTELMMKMYPVLSEIDDTEIGISLEVKNENISLKFHASETRESSHSEFYDSDELPFIIINTLTTQVQGSFDISTHNHKTEYSLSFSNKEIRGGASHLTNQDFSSK